MIHKLIKHKDGIIRYLKYLLRWQMSSVILSPCISIFTKQPILDVTTIGATIIANFVGGLIFYWIDKLLIWGDREKNNS